MPSPIRLGIVTDIQYANKPDTYLEYTKQVRHYSQALTKTRTAVKALNTHPIQALLHLGDIIDGNVDIHTTRSDLDAVMDILSDSAVPVWHVLGNHCLDAGPEHLLGRFEMSCGYYKVDIGNWRVVVLDTVDICVGREEPARSLAVRYLEEHKGDPNAKEWNGGLGEKQKEWLREMLSGAEGNILVCGHLPVVCTENEEEVNGLLLWDAEQVHDMFVEFGVRAYFGGHFHYGDYIRKDGVHYVTFESIIDSKHEQGSYGVVELCDRKIVIDGFGDMKSLTLEF